MCYQSGSGKSLNHQFFYSDLSLVNGHRHKNLIASRSVQFELRSDGHLQFWSQKKLLETELTVL